MTLTNQQLVYDTSYGEHSLRVALNLADVELTSPAGQPIAGNATATSVGLAGPAENVVASIAADHG